MARTSAAGEAATATAPAAPCIDVGHQKREGE